MLTSLRSRLLATYLLVAGLVLALVGSSLVFFLVSSPVAERRVYQRLEILTEAVAGREARVLAQVAPERAELVLARLGLGQGRLLLISSEGRVLLDSRPQLPLPPDEVLSRVTDQGGERGRYRAPTGRTWLFVSRRLGDGRLLILAAPGVTLGTLLGVGEDILLPILEAGVVAVAASLLLAWLMARWVSAPLRRMVEAVRAVAAGNYQGQIPLSGPSEVHSLAKAFNDMVRQVEASRQAQKDFVANVSHDLRTPLTAIQGFAQAILDGAARDEASQAHAARVIYEESDRLRRLVDTLLDLARLDAGQMVFSMALVDVNAVVRTVLERLSLKAAEKGVRLESRLGEIPSLLADGDRLAQVFTNLVDNALQHTPSGGTVTVSTLAEPGWAVADVTDTGPGIPAEDLARIFDRFYQVDRSRAYGPGRGAGLGLAIARQIVQAHGGTLTVQSTPGEGSCFTVRLPVAHAGDATPARSKRSGA